MRNLIILIFLFSIAACQSGEKKHSGKELKTFPKQQKKQIKIENPIVGNTSDSKVFYQCDPNCIWEYYHPFADTSYVFAVQNCGEEYLEKGKTARIYFGIDRGQTDKIIWGENVFIKTQKDVIEYKDFNGDDVDDIVIFSETGARGSNSYYFLYLVDSKNHKVNRVLNFEDIVNPEYNKKYNVILGYGYSGTNNYSVYKISKANKVYQIGASFEDDFDGDEEVLDANIKEILDKNRK